MVTRRLALPPGAGGAAAAGRLEVLAGVLIACKSGGGHAGRDVGRADGGEGGRVAGLGTGGDAVGLGGGGLGEQLDGEAGVAGGVAALGVGQDGGGFVGGVGGEGESGFGGQGAEDCGELGGGVAGEVDDGGNRAASAGVACSMSRSGPAWPARMMASSSPWYFRASVRIWYRQRRMCWPWPGRSCQACAPVIITRSPVTLTASVTCAAVSRAVGPAGRWRGSRSGSRSAAAQDPGIGGRLRRRRGTCRCRGRR